MFLAQTATRNNPLTAKIFNFQRADSIFIRVFSRIFQDGLIGKKNGSRLMPANHENGQRAKVLESNHEEGGKIQWV
jgi:hypothetical protein